MFKSIDIKLNMKYAILFLIYIVILCPGSSMASTIIQDSSGRNIVVKHAFKRIISLYGAHTVNLLYLGAASSLVGICPEDRQIPELGGKRVFSYHDGPERFLAAKPDLILIRPMIDRGYPSLIRKLEGAGIVVVSLQPRSVEQMYRYWHILGILTGKEARAQEMIRSFKEAINRISKIVSKIPVNERKKVYFEAIHSKMKTFSPVSITIFCLKTAGGINVASDAIPVRNTNIAQYGKERILAKGNEIDVYLAQVGPMNRVTVKTLKNESGFQAIKAIRTGQVFLLDEKLVSRPTPDLLRGILTVAHLLYPKYFPDNGINPKIFKDFFIWENTQL